MGRPGKGQRMLELPGQLEVWPGGGGRIGPPASASPGWEPSSSRRGCRGAAGRRRGGVGMRFLPPPRDPLWATRKRLLSVEGGGGRGRAASEGGDARAFAPGVPLRAPRRGFRRGVPKKRASDPPRPRGCGRGSGARVTVKAERDPPPAIPASGQLLLPPASRRPHLDAVAAILLPVRHPKGASEEGPDPAPAAPSARGPRLVSAAAAAAAARTRHPLPRRDSSPPGHAPGPEDARQVRLLRETAPPPRPPRRRQPSPGPAPVAEAPDWCPGAPAKRTRLEETGAFQKAAALCTCLPRLFLPARTNDAASVTARAKRSRGRPTDRHPPPREEERGSGGGAAVRLLISPLLEGIPWAGVTYLGRGTNLCAEGPPLRLPKCSSGWYRAHAGGGAVTPNLGTTSSVSTLREDAGDRLGEQEVGLRGTYDLHPWGEETAEGRTLPSPWQGSRAPSILRAEKEKKSQQLSPFHTPLQWKNPPPWRVVVSFPGKAASMKSSWQLLMGWAGRSRASSARKARLRGCSRRTQETHPSLPLANLGRGGNMLGRPAGENSKGQRNKNQGLVMETGSGCGGV